MVSWGAKERGQSEEGRIASRGVSIAYETAGAGPPVLLVHGFASSLATNWKGTGWFDALLKAGYRVVAFDNRGHGASDKPKTPGTYRIEAMAEDAEAVIAHLSLDRPAVFGYSMGARIVLSLHIRAPGIARAAIVGGAGAGVLRPLDPQGVARMADAFAVADPGLITDPFARRFRLFAERQKGDLAALGQCYREALTPLNEAELAKIDMPVLVACGAEDDHITDPQGLAHRLPQGRFVSVPGKDHMTVIADPRYKTAILDFLNAAR